MIDMETCVLWPLHAAAAAATLQLALLRAAAVTRLHNTAHILPFPTHPHPACHPAGTAHQLACFSRLYPCFKFDQGLPPALPLTWTGHTHLTYVCMPGAPPTVLPGQPHCVL